MATVQIDSGLGGQLKEFVLKNRLEYPTVKFIIDRIVADFLNKKVEEERKKS